MPDLSPEAIYAQIMQRVPEHDFDPSLDRIIKVLDLMGNPQNDFKSIHITGTNGKTSTASFCAALIQNMGLKCGLFTSPHLVKVNERIKINGFDIPDADFAQTYQEVLPFADMVENVSFFEFLTIMGYTYFSNQAVDYAVIEVGMGGSWDATNVITPQASIITPISIEHTNYLGDSLASIAKEKAGIIKPGVPAIISPQPDEAMAEIAKRSKDLAGNLSECLISDGSDFELLTTQKAVGGSISDFKTPQSQFTEIYLDMFGDYQIHNMMAAVTACESIFGPLPHEIVEDTFASVKVKGRLQLIKSDPSIFIDAAHNPGGFAELITAIRENFEFGRIIGVIGILADKDSNAILDLLEGTFDELIITQSQSERSIPFSELYETAKLHFDERDLSKAKNIKSAISKAIDHANQDPSSSTGIFATGSITLIGELLKLTQAG